MIFLPAVPYVVASASALLTFKRIKKLYDLVRYSDDIESAVSEYQNTLQTTANEAYEKTSQNIEILSNSSPVRNTDSLAPTAPTNFIEYLQRQNETFELLSKKIDSLAEQSAHYNLLFSESLSIQNKLAANISLLSETVSATAPALVLQMQELSKIPTALSLASDVKSSFLERISSSLENIVPALQSLEISSYVNVPQASVIVESDSSAINALTTATSSLKDGLLNKLEPLAQNALKQKEIADYKTTPLDIKNLDGVLVATLTPLQIRTIKDAVVSRNETDEMEFSLDDDILDSFTSSIPLPSYTRANQEADFSSILESMGSSNG